MIDLHERLNDTATRATDGVVLHDPSSTTDTAPAASARRRVPWPTYVISAAAVSLLVGGAALVLTRTSDPLVSTPSDSTGATSAADPTNTTVTAPSTTLPTPTQSELERMVNAPLPLDPYIAGSTEAARANGVLLASCMTNTGFPSEPEVASAPFEALHNLSPGSDVLGLLDRAHAVSFGYHGDPTAPPPGRFGERGADEVAATIECQGGISQQLWPDGPLDQTLANELLAQTTATVTTSPAYRDAVERWQECMARAGFHAVAPANAPQTFAAPEPSPTEAEKAAATADVDCKISAGVATVWRQQTEAVQQQLLDEHSSGLQRILDEVARADQHARDALAGS